jgi:integrase
MKGHVKLRGKVWYAILSVRDERTNKRKVRFVSLPNCHGRREAQIECARLVTEAQTGGYVEPGKTTVAQFLERWLNHIQTQVSPRTHGRYCELMRTNVVPLLGAVPLAKLRPERISEAYAESLATLSPQTVNHMHTVLKAALKQARIWKAIADNPAELVKPPKVERKEMKTVDADQTVQMFEAARGTMVFIPILLGVLCGLRRGEILALRWRSVDLEKGRLSVVASTEQFRGVREKETKSGKGRLVALPPMLVAELRRYRVQQAEWFLRLGVRLTDDHHVVTKEDGESMWPSSLGRAVRKFMQQHGQQVRLHGLRHSHATQMLAQGVHPKIAQERLGHSSISITLDLYSHVLPGMQEDAVAKVDAALQAAMNKTKPK